MPQDSKLPEHGNKLEDENVVQRVKAVIANDDRVDVEYWALPNETVEQARARHKLRSFAHRWWVYRLKQEAKDWLRHHGNDKVDRQVVDDCLRRATGSDYWEWHHGSCLLFWWFPEEWGWSKDAIDGVPFWHIAEPPIGRHFQNIPPETRDGELQIRAKVLQLKFRRYIEGGFCDLVTPTFPVEKAIDLTTGERYVRAVWDSKRTQFSS